MIVILYVLLGIIVGIGCALLGAWFMIDEIEGDLWVYGYRLNRVRIKRGMRKYWQVSREG